MPLASPLSRFSHRCSLYSLDSARNRLLKIDVIATAISMTMGIGAVVTGVFGMNLKFPQYIHREDDEHPGVAFNQARAAASRSGARSSPAAHDPRRCFTDAPCPPPWRPRGLASSWPPQSARPQVAQQPQRAHAIQTRRGKKKRREKITTRRKSTPPIAATACGRAWWWCGVRARGWG